MPKQLFYSIALLLATLLLQSCLLRPEPIRATCSPEGDYIDLGRVSFTMPFDSNWYYSLKPDREIISVHYLKEGVSSAVNVASYTNEYRYFDINWDKVESIKQFIDNFLEPRVRGMKRHKLSFDTKLVTVGPLTCVRAHEIQNIAEYQKDNPGSKQGGYEEDVTYYCPVPKQPGKLPILVGISQSVGFGRAPHDLDAYMRPILESMIINPNPPDNPSAIPQRSVQPY